jgi:hypothetical protein
MFTENCFDIGMFGHQWANTPENEDGYSTAWCERCGFVSPEPHKPVQMFPATGRERRLILEAVIAVMARTERTDERHEYRRLVERLSEDWINPSMNPVKEIPQEV